MAKEILGHLEQLQKVSKVIACLGVVLLCLSLVWLSIISRQIRQVGVIHEREDFDQILIHDGLEEVSPLKQVSNHGNHDFSVFD